MNITDETRVGATPQSSGAVPAPRAVLAVVHATGEGEAGRRYPVGEEDVTLGREEGNTVVVASDQASRRHARIFVSGGNHVLVDLEHDPLGVELDEHIGFCIGAMRERGRAGDAR